MLSYVGKCIVICLYVLTCSGRHNLPPQLEAWLIDPITHTCKRDIATLAVELGPNGSFYARDKDSYRWHNLPDALEDAIQQRLCPNGWLARPDFIVLGADGAFIYTNDRGGHSFALGNYPRLQELVLGLQRTNVGGGPTGFALLQVRTLSPSPECQADSDAVGFNVYIHPRAFCRSP